MNARGADLPGAGASARRGEDSPEDLRSRLLSEATRMFAEEGFARTSVRILAERCGCTKPALYYYFKNKEALYREVVTAQIDQVRSLMDATVRAEGDLQQRLSQGIQGLISYATQDPFGLLLLHRAPHRHDAGPKDAEREMLGLQGLHMRALEQLFGEAIERGEISASVHPRACAIAFAGTIDFRIQLWLQGDEGSLEDLDSVIDLLFNGMKHV